jgi:hypothetical protein
MSRKSRRRNKVLAAIVGLAGASKLGILPKGSTVGMGSSDMYTKAARARKVGMKNKLGPLDNVKDTVASGITKLKRSDLPDKRNMKSIFVGDDGSITKGLEKFKNKEIYAKTMKERRGRTGLKDFLNKVVLGPKTQLKKGKMVKARGGGMARMKPTKLY